MYTATSSPIPTIRRPRSNGKPTHLVTPFHGKCHLSSFVHILGLVGIQSELDTVKNAIIRGLSGQYFS